MQLAQGKTELWPHAGIIGHARAPSAQAASGPARLLKPINCRRRTARPSHRKRWSTTTAPDATASTEATTWLSSALFNRYPAVPARSDDEGSPIWSQLLLRLPERAGQDAALRSRMRADLGAEHDAPLGRNAPRPRRDVGTAPNVKTSLWRRADSNRRPLACHASALPAELRPRKHSDDRRCGRPAQHTGPRLLPSKGV